MTQLPIPMDQLFDNFDDFEMDYGAASDYITPELEQWIQEQIADDTDHMQHFEWLVPNHGMLPDLGQSPNTIETITSGTPGSTMPSPGLPWQVLDNDTTGNDILEELFPGIWPPFEALIQPIDYDPVIQIDEDVIVPDAPLPIHEVVMFVCHCCNQVFPSDAALRSHNEHVHSRFNHCLVLGCGWSWETQKDLRRHVETVHSDERNFFCPNEGCGRGFKRKDILQRHVKGRCRSRS